MRTVNRLQISKRRHADQFNGATSPVEAGAILATAGFFVIFLLILCAFVLDGYFLLSYKLQQRNNAEYTAIERLRKLTSGGSNTVTVYANNHYVTAGVGVAPSAPAAGDIKCGSYSLDSSSQQYKFTAGTCSAATTAVQVTLREAQGGPSAYKPLLLGWRFIGLRSFAGPSVVTVVAWLDSAKVVRVTH